MIELKIKPLSINEAWKGKRFKTDKYDAFEKECLWLLPNFEVNANAKLEVKLTFYFSNKNADIDNPVKMCLDVLQKRYLFNDAIIFRLIVEKENVKKGDEKIKIEINEID